MSRRRRTKRPRRSAAELELQHVQRDAKPENYGQDEQAWRLTWSLP